MEKVDGIGGFFFRSKNPKALAEWYERNLGINPVPDSADKKAWRQEAGSTAFAPFGMDSKAITPPEQQWMINFRVRNMDAMAEQLRKAGTEVEVDPTVYSIGRFAQLRDPEGNPVQLWEPKER